MRPQMVVDGAADHFGIGLAREIDMRDLRQRMHPGIGASGAEYGRPVAGKPLKGGLERLLHREAVGLALPANEARPVIFDCQLVAGHGNRVPAGIGKPRRKASASSAARPGRCNRSG